MRDHPRDAHARLVGAAPARGAERGSGRRRCLWMWCSRAPRRCARHCAGPARRATSRWWRTPSPMPTSPRSRRPVDGDALVAGSAGLVGAIALRETGERHRSPGARLRGAPRSSRAAARGAPSSRSTASSPPEAPPSVSRPNPATPAEQLAARAVEWWDRQPDDAAALLYSSSPASERRDDVPGAGELYERTAGLIAAQLSDRGVKRMLIAGGETSGEVVRALGTTVAVVGEEVAPGAPWIHDERRDVHLILKSGTSVTRSCSWTSLGRGSRYERRRPPRDRTRRALHPSPGPSPTAAPGTSRCGTAITSCSPRRRVSPRRHRGGPAVGGRSRRHAHRGSEADEGGVPSTSRCCGCVLT